GPGRLKGKKWSAETCYAMTSLTVTQASPGETPSVPPPSRLAVLGVGEHKAGAGCPVVVAGLLEHGQGPAQMAARLVVCSPGVGAHPRVGGSAAPPAGVAEAVGEGRRLRERARGPPVPARFAAQEAGREIGVGHVAATPDGTEDFPATSQ